MRLLDICILAAAFLAAPFGFSQAPPAFPLESIRIQGNEQFPADRVIAATGLKIGQGMVKSDFDRARDRLMATGGFEKVGYEYKPNAAQTGYDAVFEVVEASPLFRIRFEEIPASEASLKDTLRALEPLYDGRIPATPQVMNRFSEALAKSIGGGIEVIGDVNADTPGELMILFRPLGERSTVAEVYFNGNRAVDTGDLTRAILGSAVGVRYSEPLFRQMLDGAVRPLYEERGYIRVTFPSIAVAKAAENKGLVITVTVDDGPVYKLGTVEYRGVERGRLAAIEKLADLPAGINQDEVANFKQIGEALARVRKQFREDGYLRVGTTVERVIQETQHVVNLVVNLDSGPRFKMGKLTINGLDILSEPVIRKMWQLQSGAPYRESYADALLARIQSEGLFDNLDRTGAEAVVHDDTETVDVTLTFLGAKPATDQQRRRR